MPPEKLPGTEDTVGEDGTGDTLAASVSPPRSSASSRSGTRTPTTVGDSLRGANIESFESVDGDRYEVLGEIARGGLGRVMRARDPRTGRTVALKEIIVPTPDTVARFAREALVTANLQHPSIVPVYEVGRWPDGEPFYTMKLVQGRTLSDLIGEAKTAAARMALLPHAIAVADALAYAHSEHVIHRDLKPGNVLVGAYGETVVIDWGLARNTATGQEVGALSNPSIDLGTETVVGTVMGTPSYMPPEQALGAPIDEGADVYAIGALMYHMLSGARPYADAKTVEEVVERVKTGPPAPLATLAPETPPELIAIVEKAMARKLAGRYRSAEGLAEDLRRFQTGKLVGAHRYTTWQLVQRWIRKYRAVLGVAGAALIVLVVVAVISVKRIAAERDLAQQQRGLAQTAEQLAVSRFASSLEELARQASVAGTPDRVLPILAGVPAAHRTANLGILAGQAREAFAGLFAMVPAQVKGTLSAAITHDGKLLVTTSGEGVIIAWDVDRAAQRWTTMGGAVLLSPDDKSLLVLFGHEISLLSPVDGKQLAHWQFGDVLETGSWSTSGDRFAVGGAKGTVAIGTPTGPLVPSDNHAKQVRAVGFSPDGTQLASIGDDGLVIVRDGKSPARRFAGAKKPMSALVWSDATHVIAAGEDETARLWNTATGALERSYAHGAEIYGVTMVAPDHFATFGWGEHLKIWPIAGGEPRELVGHRMGLDFAVMLGDALVAADATGQVIAWNPLTGERLRTLPTEGLISGLVARGGDVLVEIGERRTRLWHLDPGAIVRRLTGHTARTRDLAFGGDGLWTTSNDGTVRSYALDGTPRLVLGTGDLTEPIVTGPADPNAKAPPNPHSARGVTLAPDGKRVATTYEDGRILLWDATTGAQLASWTGHTGRVRGVVFSPDGATAYSIGDSTVRKWDATSGRELARADLGDTGWAVALRDDVVATQTDHGIVALWSAATLAKGAPVGTGSKGYLRDMAFVDDGLVVADKGQVGYLDIHTGQFTHAAPRPFAFSSDIGPETVAVGDVHGELAIYDKATLTKIRSWRIGDDSPVNVIRYRPDGKVLATASARNVRIWDPAGALLAELSGLPTELTRIAWSPDGTHLAIMGGAPNVWLWDLTPAEPAVSCAITWQLADATLVAAPPQPTWCAPTSR